MLQHRLLLTEGTRLGAGRERPGSEQKQLSHCLGSFLVPGGSMELVGPGDQWFCQLSLSFRLAHFRCGTVALLAVPSHLVLSLSFSARP